MMATRCADTLPPIATVTFLFTDIEGSSRLWDTVPDSMRPALARHGDLARAVEDPAVRS
jgi:class 3 adenylate cyclase